MPNPTTATSIGRPDLGMLAYEYALAASQRGFIGLKALPLFPVMERSGQYPIIPNEALLKMPSVSRAPGGMYNRGGWEFELGTFDCLEYGWEEPLDDSEANLYRRYFDAEEVAVQRAVDIILRAQEKRIADMLLNESNFSVHDITEEWDDAANAVPINDVNTGIKTIRQATGIEPNVLIIGRTVFDNLCTCNQIKNAMVYTNPIEIMNFEAKKRAVAQILGLEDILVGGAVYDSAKKGQSYSAADVWGTEHGLLCRVDSSSNLKTPCVGRTFIWTPDAATNAVVEEYREEQTRSTVYRCRQYTDEAFVFTAAGYLLGNLTA